MNLQTKLFSWSVLLNIALAVLVFFLLRSNGENSEAHDRDREVLIKGAEQQKLKDDSIITAERQMRTQEQAQHERDKKEYRKGRSENTIAISHLNASRDSAGIKVDPFTAKIEKKYKEQRVKDSLEIVRLEKKIFSDSSSFERQISAETDKYLQQVVISDQHLEEVQELKTDLKKEKKRKTGWKIAAIALAGWVVYQEVKD